jgi:tRNA G18 (ribose-2'-O)-methylase SpoU
LFDGTNVRLALPVGSWWAARPELFLPDSIERQKHNKKTLRLSALSITLTKIILSRKMTVECYVVVHNIAKRHNVGTLARSATAFGVSELILVGRRDLNTFGSHGSTSHLRFRHFHSLSDARLFLKV